MAVKRLKFENVSWDTPNGQSSLQYAVRGHYCSPILFE
jgi:hypothetical protein